MDLAILLLDDMSSGGNVSGGISAYEGMATRQTPTQMLSKRYGCDRKAEHHARTRCMLQGRLDQMKLELERTRDPQQRLKLQMKIATWQEKMNDEIRRSRFRKD